MLLDEMPGQQRSQTLGRTRHRGFGQRGLVLKLGGGKEGREGVRGGDESSQSGICECGG